ncbi:hypothetical protein D9M72_615510 [compost metagenome]
MTLQHVPRQGHVCRTILGKLALELVSHRCGKVREVAVEVFPGVQVESPHLIGENGLIQANGVGDGHQDNFTDQITFFFLLLKEFPEVMTDQHPGQLACMQPGLDIGLTASLLSKMEAVYFPARAERYT